MAAPGATAISLTNEWRNAFDSVSSLVPSFLAPKWGEGSPYGYTSRHDDRFPSLSHAG